MPVLSATAQRRIQSVISSKFLCTSSTRSNFTEQLGGGSLASVDILLHQLLQLQVCCEAGKPAAPAHLRHSSLRRLCAAQQVRWRPVQCTECRIAVDIYICEQRWPA